MDNLDQNGDVDYVQLPVMKKVLKRDGDKVASILALDLFLVGVDTVSYKFALFS